MGGDGKVVRVKNKNEYKKWLSKNAPSDKVIVDFFASWCPPCRIISPVYEELSKKYSTEGVTFLTVDVDEVRAAAENAGIKSMPTFQIYYKGEYIDKVVGADKVQLEGLVKKIIAMGEGAAKQDDGGKNEQMNLKRKKKSLWKRVFCFVY